MYKNEYLKLKYGGAAAVVSIDGDTTSNLLSKLQFKEADIFRGEIFSFMTKRYNYLKDFINTISLYDNINTFWELALAINNDNYTKPLTMVGLYYADDFIEKYKLDDISQNRVVNSKNINYWEHIMYDSINSFTPLKI